MAQDPQTIIRSKGYLRLLAIAAILGVPISAAAYYFLIFIENLQWWAYNNLPRALGYTSTPKWWPLVPLFVASLLVGLTIRYLPGKGGNSPADGFKAGETPKPVELPGILLAAAASIGLGAAIGPEGPLVALGGGLAFLAIRLVAHDLQPNAGAVVAATGSFAAISTLMGSPITGAFFLLEASGLGGPKAALVLVPGLLGSGIGSLIFIGLGSFTGKQALSLTIPNLPYFARPTLGQFGWAIVIGLAAALLGTVIRRLAFVVRAVLARKLILLTIVAGLVIAGLAIAYTAITGKPNADVLFSGQAELPELIRSSAGYSAGVLVLLMLCKGLAYCISLAGFRGGPTFPALFIGAAGGIALSHLPGLPMIPAIAMGIGAMSTVMLRLPFTSVLLTTILLASAGLAVMPLVIVAVVVAYVTVARLTPNTQSAGRS